MFKKYQEQNNMSFVITISTRQFIKKRYISHIISVIKIILELCLYLVFTQLILANDFTEKTTEVVQGKKCAQQAIFLATHAEGHPMDYNIIDQGLQYKNIVSLKEVLDFLKSHQYYCIVKNYKQSTNMSYIANYLKFHKSGAIIAIKLDKDKIYHFADLCGIHDNKIEIFDTRSVEIYVRNKQPSEWPVILITKDTTTFLYWKYIVPVVNFIINVFCSPFVTIILITSLFYIIFTRYKCYNINRVFWLKKPNLSGPLLHIMVLGAFIVIFLIIALKIVLQKNSVSVLRVEPPSVDLGEIPIGTKVDIQLTVKNMSRKSVPINKVLSSCSCFNVDINRDVIHKSSSAIVNASIKVSSLGRKANRVVVVPASKDVSSVEAIVTVTGINSGRLIPAKSDLGTFSSLKKSSRTLVLQFVDYEGLPLMFRKVEKKKSKWSEKIDVSLKNPDVVLSENASVQVEITSLCMESGSVFDLDFILYKDITKYHRGIK